jgi:CDP-diacylglycerol--glycerol-3-phosphate 3-phosphatidyltransferase
MITQVEPGELNSLHRLRREWGGYVLASMTFLLVVFLLLGRFWGAEYSWRWLCVSGAISVYQFIYLFNHLLDNRLKSGGGTVFPTLGIANWITLTRAILNAALAGFLMGPWPVGPLSWAPSILYLISVLMDFADGFAARVSGRTTVLGEGLDMKWDGAGVLVTSLLVVFYGQAPLPYVLVGLARYLYLLGQWLYTNRGLPLFDLPPSPIRRPFAGLQMGFIAVILMPVFSPPLTQVAAWVFMLPFLTLFLRDWLVVSGVIGQASSAPGLRKVRMIFHWLWISFPLAVRSILVFLLVEFFIHSVTQPSFDWVFLLISAFAVLAFFLGAAGRFFSLAVLLMAGFGLQMYPVEWRYWALFLFSAMSMMLGTGRFSLWKPEDWLLYKHAGERRPTSPAR